MTACTAYAELVVADALGTVEDADLERVAAAAEHRKTCDDCVAFLAHATDALQDAALPDVDPPAGAWEDLASRIEADRSRGELRVLLSCTFCHDVLERGGAIYCASCLAPHHGDCFRDHGRCSAPGCDEVRVVQASELAPKPKPTRNRAWPVWAGVAVAFVGGAAAALAPMELNREETQGATPSLGSLTAPRPVIRHEDGTVTVQALEGDLETICELLSQSGGEEQWRVLAEPEITGSVTVSAKALPWRNAVTAVATAVDAEVVERPAARVLIITQKSQFRRSYTDVALHDVLRDLASASGKNIVVGPEVRGRVTQDFDGLSPLQVLHTVVKGAGDYEIVADTEDLLRVVPRSSIHAQLETVIIELNAPAPAMKLRSVLQRVFEETKKNENAFLDYDERINSLILMATKPTLVHVQRYLEKHDLRQPVKMTSPVIHHRGGVISVVAKDMDLADLFRQIGAAVTQTIEVSEHIDERVSIELWQVNWRVALNRIAQQTQCNVNEFPGGVFGITQPALINVEANEEDVRDVVQKIAKQAGVSIILHPEFKATLTLDLRMVHWLRALHAIIKTVGEFELIEETDDLLRVVPSSSIEVQLETTVFKLKGSGVSTSGLKRFVTRTFQRLGEPEGATIDFVADANSGSGQVVLVASKPGAYQIKRLLKKLGALAEDR